MNVLTSISVRSRSRNVPTQTRSRSARRALATGILAFLGATVAFAVWIERADEFRDPAYGEKFGKLKFLCHSERKSLLVAFGSSRIAQGFDALEAERTIRGAGADSTVVFNFGIAGGGPITDSIYFRRMLRAGVVPDAIVFEVFPRMLHHEPNGPAESQWLSDERLSQAESAEFSIPFRSHIPWLERRSSILCCNAAFFLTESKCSSLMHASDERGWQPYGDLTVSPDQRAIRTRETKNGYAPALAKLDPGGRAAEELQRTTRDCHARGIPVLLLLMPEGTVFRDAYGPGAEDRLQSFLRALEVPVCDARTWFDDDQFADGHHFLSSGAAKFTKRLTTDVLIPFLRERGRP